MHTTRREYCTTQDQATGLSENMMYDTRLRYNKLSIHFQVNIYKCFIFHPIQTEGEKQYTLFLVTLLPDFNTMHIMHRQLSRFHPSGQLHRYYVPTFLYQQATASKMVYMLIYITTFIPPQSNSAECRGKRFPLGTYIRIDF